MIHLEKTHKESWWRNILSMPFIYALIVPFVLLDVFLEIYHRVCFPLFGLTKIQRSAYIRVDRHRLSYLNGIQKLNCMYCGYINGLIAYTTQIAATTEAYWCGIKHDTDPGRIFYPPQHHADFLEYGDASEFKKIGK